MKKINYLFNILILLIIIHACSGYKPIFSSKNIEFKIGSYALEGNKKLGKQIYSKLYNLAKSNKNNPDAKSIDIVIKVTKDKNSTSKDSAGKVLEYKLILNTKITVKDFLSNEQILDHNFTASSSYKVQAQFSETLKLENRSTENLMNKTYQDLLMKLSENILNI